MFSIFFILTCTTILADSEPTQSKKTETLRIQTQMFDIEYEVNEEALPLVSVQLWYTVDGGATWQLFGEDEDRHPPIGFLAPREGEYGFYLRMVNEGGASGPPPVVHTPPQLFAFVDFTPPVVQLHAPTQTSALSQRVLRIPWTAVDAHFPSRPIQIMYQWPVGGEWRAVSPDPIANTGRFDWRVPNDLSGVGALRVVATDRGGFRVESEIAKVELAVKIDPLPTRATGEIGIPAPVRLTEPVRTAESTDSAKTQAVRLYAEALAHRDRGEYRQAVARLRDVVRLDPESVAAVQEMASLLYMSGDYDRSLEAYNLVLARQPMQRAAVLGVARVHRQRQEYETAAEKLRALLRFNPTDGEAWMALGDIGVYKGDEILARECYTRAMHAKSGDTAVIEDARQRLSLMTELNRSAR